MSEGTHVHVDVGDGVLIVRWTAPIAVGPKERPAFRSLGQDRIDVADAPDLVAALLRRGAIEAARTVNAAWFVCLAQAAGHDNITLGP